MNLNDFFEKMLILILRIVQLEQLYQKKVKINIFGFDLFIASAMFSSIINNLICGKIFNEVKKLESTSFQKN